jgi:large-conductance mechanosensitive channel
MPNIFALIGMLFAFSMYFRVLDNAWFAQLHPLINASEWLLILLKLAVIFVSIQKMTEYSETAQSTAQSKDPEPQMPEELISLTRIRLTLRVYYVAAIRNLLRLFKS